MSIKIFSAYLFVFLLVFYFSLSHVVGFLVYLAAIFFYLRAVTKVALTSGYFKRGAWAAVGMTTGTLIIECAVLNARLHLIDQEILKVMLPTAVFSIGIGFFCAIDIIRNNFGKT